ncbi:MAG: glycosyltransferase [Chthoniobacteraceae bacterium]
MPPLDYSIVIATYERPRELAVTLASLAAQTRRPAQVIVVDSSPNEESRAVVEATSDKLPLTYLRAIRPSSAVQRNQGAESVTSPLIVFLDDDVTLSRDVFELLCIAFETDLEQKTAGVAARIEGMQHPKPRGPLRWYYRLQAGYADVDYGARLLGPAINTLPTYADTNQDLIPSEWLNSTCVMYRTEFFRREKFPEFTGYSSMEDVHTSSRIRRHGALFFHRTALFQHHDAPSSYKRDPRAMLHQRLHNQRLIAREILRVPEPVLTLKMLLHRIFVTYCVLRGGSPQRWKEVAGAWT